MESELFIQTLCLSLCLLVKIENLPSLVGTVVSWMNLDLLAFNILSLVNIEALVRFLDIAEVLSAENKDLPPSRVGAIDLHIFGSSRVLDVERLVVVLGSDGQGLLMEVPDLTVSSVGCLDHHVSVVDKVKVSVFRQLRDNVEWSFNVQSEFLVQFSFAWLTLPFINIHDIPLLPKSISLSIDTNVSIFCVNISDNLHNFTLLIDDRSTLVSEHLPPSRVSSSTSEVIRSTITLNVKRM
jgi:hypothetical protein